MAMTFVDASDNRVDVGQTPTARNVPAVTIMCWVNAATLPAGRHTFFGFSGGAATGQTRAKISFQGQNLEGGGRALDGDSFQAFEEVGGVLATGVWIHVAARFDYVARTIELFKDGVSVGLSGTLTGWTSGNTSDTDSLEGSVGAQHGATSEGIDADVEDARIYDRLLSDQEIATIFNAHGTDGILNGLQHRYFMREAAPGTTASGAGSVKDLGPLGDNGSPVNMPVYAVGILRDRRKVA